MQEELKISKGEWKKLKHGILAEKLKRSGYKINSWLIILGFLIPAGLLLYNGYVSGFSDKWMVNCPEDSLTPCKNPFYSCDILTTTWCPDDNLKMVVCASDPGFCLIPLLEPGNRYGDAQTFIEKNFLFIVIFCLAIFYGLNHYLYNSKEERERRKKKNEAD